MFRYITGVMLALWLSGVAFANSRPVLSCRAFTGRFIQLTTPHGHPFEVYRTGPSSATTGILLLPGAAGLDAPILNWADRLGVQGYRVVAVRLRVRHGPYTGHATAPTPRAIAEEVTAIHFLRAPGRKIVTLGWGHFGAWQSLEASAADPADVDGVMLCDGGLSAPRTLLAKTKALVLLIAFNVVTPPPKLQDFEARMRMVGRPLFVHYYNVSPQAADPVGRHFDSAIAQDIWAHARAFFARVDQLCRRCAPYPHYLFDYRN
ncbi:MAG: dienelactone hydrolase family protein [Acidiferrobacter sp.]